MPAFIGDDPISAAYIGDQPITAIYLGDTLIWPLGADMFYADNFNRADGPLGSPWVMLPGPTIVAPVIEDDEVRAPGMTLDSGAYVDGTWGPVQLIEATVAPGDDYSEGGVLGHAHDYINVILGIYTTDGTHPSFPGFGTIEGPAYQLYIANGSTYIMLDETSAPDLAPRRLLLAVRATALELWVDGVRVLAGNDSGVVGRDGPPGLTIHQDGTAPPALDDWEARTYVADLPAPTITTFTPSTANPGDVVAIDGTGLLEGCTQVTVDGTAVAVNVTSDTEGTFTVPATDPGGYSVELRTPFGTDSDTLVISEAATPPTMGATTEAFSASATPHTSRVITAPSGVTGAADERVLVCSLVASLSATAVTPSIPGFEVFAAETGDPVLSGSGIYIHRHWFISNTDHSGESTYTMTFSTCYVSRAIAMRVTGTDGSAVGAFDSALGTSVALPSVTSPDNGLVIGTAVADVGTTVSEPSGWTTATVEGSDQTWMRTLLIDQEVGGSTPSPTVSAPSTTAIMVGTAVMGPAEVVDPTAPGQVTGLDVTPGNTELLVAWDVPATGGSAITGYDVEYRTTAGPGSWVDAGHSGTSPAMTITGLTNGTGYDVRVRAVNIIGDGDWSDIESGTPDADIFNPLTLTGLVAWYDASDAASFSFSAGTTVSEWRDKSGNARHLTPTGTGPERTGTRNGLTVVDFDGTPMYFEDDAAFITTGALTVFAVVRNDGGTYGRILSLLRLGNDSDWSTGNAAFNAEGGNVWPSGYTHDSQMATHADSDLVGQWVCFDQRFDGSINTLHVEGVDETPVSIATDFDVARIAIGGRGNTGGDTSTHLAAEYLICAAHITGTMLDECRAYLEEKWGFA